MGKKRFRRLLIGATIFVLVGIGLILPTKYVVEYPGPIDEVAKYITPTKTTSVRGNLYSTSVSVRPAMGYDLIITRFRPFYELFTKEEMYGSGDYEGWQKISDFDMSQATANALFVAAKHANIPVEKNFKGIFVLDVNKKSNFFGRLKIGDLIQKVDQKEFNNLSEMQAYIADKKLNSKITLSILRDKKSLTLTGKTIKLPEVKKNGIGVSLNEQDEVKTVPEVKIKVNDLGGPSAGLIFTLELYQEFTGKDLTHGKKIAGTGTISPDGKVGIIGGVDKKVVGADAAGAKIFFVPVEQPKGYTKDETNYAVAKATAKRIKTKMKIVPVKNFDDAINYLTRQK